MTNYLTENFSLENKIAIVTGASRGLGQAMALALGASGAKVVAVGSRVSSVNNTIEQLESMGVECLGLGCDQRNGEQIKQVVADTISKFGRIDILINNAGTIKRAPAHEFSDEDWDEVIDTNLNGVFKFCRATGQQMLKQGSGKIINIASLLSFQGGITVPSYAASKGGVVQLTKALANEWAHKNIQVNAVAPGYFATDNTANLRSDSKRNENITSRIPAGEWGKPEDLTGAIVFLSGNGSNYVNGHVLLVDGGWMAR